MDITKTKGLRASDFTDLFRRACQALQVGATWHDLENARRSTGGIGERNQRILRAAAIGPWVCGDDAGWRADAAAVERDLVGES